MRREDYERMGPPQENPSKRGNLVAIGNDPDQILSVVGGDVEGTDRKVLLLIGESGHSLIVASKSAADQVIRSLIAARNEVWPEP